MYDQPRYEPHESSALFEDGQASRPQVPGTVARGMLREDRAFHTGMENDSVFTADLPFEVTHGLLARGRQRYDIFCSVCHDRAGTGRGVVVRRGFKQPSSFHEPRLRSEPVGYFFDVITNGFATMPSYAAQIPPEDRWAIVAYLRALQLSQHAPVNELPAAVRRRIERAAVRTPRDEELERSGVGR